MRDLVDELLQAKVRATLFGTAHVVRLDRLELIERLGAGAMGTVFSAFDPKLERKVAIKILHQGDGVLAEARALAKLTHPNVVAVHDVGEADGLVFIVMELVSGSPLRTWAKGRPWREVMHALRDAAKGISAAHRAGLVHRDIKPDNILVGDRPRVIDFGLALAHADGSSAGTPHYMAPEVVAGHAATPASDQFSFGVTLYEALCGVRPGQDRDPAVTARVPNWVRAIAMKACAADPGARFPDMHEVVRALRRDRRRIRFAVILAATALVGGGVGAWTMHRSATAACADAGVHRSAVWNEGVRSGVKSGLGNVPWSARTLAALDDVGARWEGSYRTVCEATRKHGDQSDALLQLRMRCLDRVLDRFGALAAALSGPKDAHALPDAPSEPTSTLDPAARAAAPSAVAALPLPAECEALTDPAELALPADPAQRDHARAAEHELDKGWAAFALGRYRDARTVASSTVDTLAHLEAPAVRAAALVLAAAVEARIGTAVDAHAKLQAALDAASTAHSGALELDVWARMLRSELFSGDPAHVIEWAPFARAAALRAGRKGAEIDGIVAEARRDTGDLAGAKALLDHAMTAGDPLRPDQLAVLELNLGSIQLAAGESSEADKTLTRARDRVIEAFGDHHPEVALYDDKLAAAARARGKLRAALALHDQSLALRTAAFGADDRAVSTSLYHRAETELEAGELSKAEHSLHQAIAIRERVYGATSARLGELYTALGDVDVARGVDPADHHAKARQLDPREAPNTSPIGAQEMLSTARAAALADAAHADALAIRYRPELDPAITVSIAQALLAAGKTDRAAELFTTALANAGTEPSRTALAAALGIAACGDARAAQANRTAISLFQAMPELGRARMPR